MSRRTMCFLAVAVAILAVVALPAAAQSGAQGDEQAKVQPAASAQYGGLPVFPSCATFTVERGNPSTGPSLLLAKTESGCIIPWHWHTAREELMVVSGTGKIEMRGMAAQPLTKGTYVRLPGKHHHQFSCQSQCVFFVGIADTFDIHYLDKSGKEIPPAQALEAVKEKPGSSQ